MKLLERDSQGHIVVVGRVTTRWVCRVGRIRTLCFCVELVLRGVLVRYGWLAAEVVFSAHRKRVGASSSGGGDVEDTCESM